MHRFAAVLWIGLSWLVAGWPAGGVELAPRLVAQVGVDGVERVFFSRDGRWLVGRATAVVLVWEVASGRLRHVFPGAEAALSADGSLLATGSWNDPVRLFDLATGEERLTLADRDVHVDDLAFSGDGSRLLAACHCGIRVWDTRSGKSLHCLGDAAQTSVWHVAASADGASWLAAGTGAVTVWDARTGARLQTLPGHTDHVDALAVSPDGTWAATAGRDRVVRLWDLVRGGERSALPIPGKWTPVAAISPDGQLVLAAAEDGVRVYAAATGRLERTFSRHREAVRALAVSPDGRFAVSSGVDSRVFLWSPATGELLQEMPAPISASGLAVSPDGGTVAVAAGSRVVLWDVAAARVRQTLEGRTAVPSSLSFAPGGGALLVNGADAFLLLPLAAGQAPRLLPGSPRKGPASAVLESRRALAWATPAGPPLAAGEMSGSVLVWDAETAELRGEWQGPWLHGLALTPDGRFVGVAAGHGPLAVWRATGQLRFAPQQMPPPGRVELLAISPDGTLLVTASFVEPGVRVWDMAAGRLRHTFDGLPGGTLGIAVSPDGESVAVSSTRPQGPAKRAMVSIYDTGSGELRRRIDGLQGPEHLAWSADGQLLAIAGEGHAAQLGDVRTGALRSSCEGSLFPLTAVALAPSGRVLAAAARDGRVLFCDAATGAPLATLYTFPGGDWAVIAPDGRWDAPRQGHGVPVNVWRGSQGADLATLPERQEPGLLAHLLAGRVAGAPATRE